RGLCALVRHARVRQRSGVERTGGRAAMRMITRCPACGTAFRIYQEQLDARQGQVRCGHCAVVFSAHEHLVVEPETAHKPSAPPPQEPVAIPPASATVASPPEPAPEKPQAPEAVQE